MLTQPQSTVRLYVISVLTSSSQSVVSPALHCHAFATPYFHPLFCRYSVSSLGLYLSRSAKATMTSSSSPSSHASTSSWLCPFHCGQVYKRSSGRSIRRHVNTCFRQHNSATTAELSDEQLSIVICDLQDSGQLATGLRRWRMRRSRRLADELDDKDRWDCIWGCGRMYRVTSSRSILHHANTCTMRPEWYDGETDIKTLRMENEEKKTKKKRSNDFDEQSSVLASSSGSSLPSIPESLSCHSATDWSGDEHSCDLPSPLPQLIPSDTPRSMSACTFGSSSSVRCSTSPVARLVSLPDPNPAVVLPYDRTIPAYVLSNIQQSLIELDSLLTYIGSLCTRHASASSHIARAPLLDDYIGTLSHLLQSPSASVPSW